MTSSFNFMPMLCSRTAHLSRFFAISFLLWSVSVSAVETLSEYTPLIGITAVADDDSDVLEPEGAAGGALEMSRYFATHLVPDLEDCGTRVAGVMNDWLQQHGMIPIQQDISQENYFMRVWELDKQGIFEAKYRSHADTRSVRVSLDFFDISGHRLALQDVNHLLSRYRLSALWMQLAEAVECDQT